MATILRFTLTLAILPVIASACSGGGITPLQPTQSATNSPTPISNAISTQPSPPEGQVTPEAVISTPVPGLLPHSLYFLNDMGDGNSQVWQLSADGASLTQITFEPEPVNDFAVSPVNGAVAYISGNKLFYEQAANGKHILLVDGGKISQENITQGKTASSQRISSPRWSPDGKSLAFGYGGINIFMLGNGKATRLLGNGLQESWAGSGNLVQADYAPYAWSPDNQRLAIAIALEGAGSTLGVFSPANGAMVRLHPPSVNPSDDLVCCQASWSIDSQSIFVANFYVNLRQPTGLWRYDPSSGAGTALIPSIEKDGTHNYVGWPVQLQDSSLIYWFANSPDQMDSEMPMKLVASGPDAVFNRTLLRPEAILPEEVLWAEKAMLAVIVQSSPGTVSRKTGGPVVLVQWKGDPVQPLLPNAYRLQWGP